MAEPIFSKRAEYSSARLQELRTRIAEQYASADLPDLVIFTAGSYARLEASEHSDIDLFFIYPRNHARQDSPRTLELRLFGRLLEIIEEMKFPPFSNDSQYLTAASASRMLEVLGSPDDDGDNYFTLRMLMLLESRCIHSDRMYKSILREVVDSYYRDYPDHQATFEPWFLLNDIARFWKTLLLNYEHKRNQNGPETDKVRQKVRNFKLKFSRMTTCFATVAALGARASTEATVDANGVLELIELTPRERLEDVAKIRSDVASLVGDVLSEYSWFLTMTALTEVELRSHFEDQGSRTELFERANNFGTRMYELLASIDGDRGGSASRFIRYLVI